MVKSVKKGVSSIAKSIARNRILMIVCVFVVMGLAVGLINYLQKKTIERFASAYVYDSNDGSTTELDEGTKHGNLHKDCKHVNNEGYHHTCGHAHTEDAAELAAEIGSRRYKINDTTKELVNNEGNPLFDNN